MPHPRNPSMYCGNSSREVTVFTFEGSQQTAIVIGYTFGHRFLPWPLLFDKLWDICPIHTLARAYCCVLPVI